MNNRFSSLQYDFEKEGYYDPNNISIKQLLKKLKYAKEHYYMTHSRKNLEKMENIKLNIIMLRGIKSKYVNKNFMTYEMRKKKKDKMNKKRIKKEKNKRKRELELKEKQKYNYYLKERECKEKERREERERKEKERREERVENINPIDVLRYDNLKRIQREFQSNKDLITKNFLCKLYCTFKYPTYVPRPIRLYFNQWGDCEKIYNIKIPEEYSLVGLKNIQKTIYTSFDKLPLDIIKIIWKFYYNPIYKKAGDMIRKFKKKIDNEKDMYNMRMNLYNK